MKNKNEKGQAVLVILLTMLVVLTIVVAIFTSSLSDTSVTITQENSEKAFSLAEAGIESLLAGKEPDINIDGFTVATETSADKEFEAYVKQNDTVTLDVEDEIDGSGNNGIIIFWSLEGDSEEDPDPRNCDDPSSGQMPASIIVTKWRSDDSTEPFWVKAWSSVPCQGEVAGEENFVQNAYNPDNEYLSARFIGLSEDDLIVNIRPVYNGATIKVRANNGTLKNTQQFSYVSEAQVNETLETRKIEVVQTLADLPDVFDYVLFSGNTLIHE